MPRLLTLDEAATELGVPRASLRSAAERHGFLVRMGRALRIDPETVPELIEKCRSKPRVPAGTGEARETTTSGTKAASSSQRAQATADRLIERSRATSRKRTGLQVLGIPLR